MTAKHRDPLYRMNAKLIRQIVARKRRAGTEVTCWRCGNPIEPEQSYDVGHIDADGGHELSNLAPEHRYRQAFCIGNRSAGGKSAHRPKRATPPAAPTSNMLPW